MQPAKQCYSNKVTVELFELQWEMNLTSNLHSCLNSWENTGSTAVRSVLCMYCMCPTFNTEPITLCYIDAYTSSTYILHSFVRIRILYHSNVLYWFFTYMFLLYEGVCTICVTFISIQLEPLNVTWSDWGLTGTGLDVQEQRGFIISKQNVLLKSHKTTLSPNTSTSYP